MLFAAEINAACGVTTMPSSSGSKARWTTPCGLSRRPPLFAVVHEPGFPLYWR